ncbi:MAG: guanylate kinase [Mesorhizobium sp.]|nr:guanylate kinase [Mesorhizobium sp.]MBL8579364.1 guanylate kinase [Mesorhizobium sp.]
MVASDVGSAIRRRGLMLVLSSPSGAGKSTIARLLLDPKSSEGTGFELSISYTTRERRSSEIDGVHYHFVSPREFERLRDDDAFLEWAEVHGNFYATPREPAEAAMAAGRDMLFDIDWQGADQLRDKVPADIVSVFILPPSMAELRDRLLRRAEDQSQVIEQRLKNAREEIAHWRKYDYIIVNDDLQRAFGEVRSIVTSERLRRDRRPGLFDFVSGLLDEKI